MYEPQYQVYTLGPKSAIRLPSTIDTDHGTLSVESEYIPGVVACEIGKRIWSIPAMEAQAIAARTYLARFLERTRAQKVVPIGPRFQCWKKTRQQQFVDVARDTSGQVLLYKGRLITANYVAGSTQMTPDCDALPPTAVRYDFESWTDMLAQYREDRKRSGRTLFQGIAWTEIFVTRNEGRSGTSVKPSAIANPVPTNRGALGQNAAVCLANNLGYETTDILHYFYGEDVELAQLNLSINEQ